MNESATIYVVDDDDAVLLSVKALLSQHGYEVRCYMSAGQFLAEAPVDSPGCVITDVQMPGISGMELQQRLLAAKSLLSVIVVTGVADVPTAVALMESGAVTLLEKPYDHNDMLSAVERGLTASRERWEQWQEEQYALERLATLTDDERHVMKCMLAGQPNKAIASRLDLSMRTVDRRRQAVLEKMGVTTVPELALLLGTTRLSPPHTPTRLNPARS
jgi:FixJ family two-component response regulator